MSIASEITRLQGAKADLKTAIEGKGVSVPSSAKLDAYASYVSSIDGGGGGGTDWEDIARGMIDQITEFDIPSTLEVDASKNYVMYNRAGLKSCTIKSGITSIGTNSFYNCTGLLSIIVPNTVTTINVAAFQNCLSMASITLSSALITLGQSALQGLTSLTTITIPSSVTTCGNNFLRGCTALTEVIMQPTSPPTLGTNAFNGSSSLASIYVPDASVSTYKGASGWSSFSSMIKSINDRT